MWHICRQVAKLTIRTRLDPNVDGTLALFASVRAVAARVSFVNVVLNNSAPDHGQAPHKKATSNTLQRCEVDLHFSLPGVNEAIEDRNEDDERDGIQVGDDIVGNTIEFHGSGLRCQVVEDLVVREPVKREPQEHTASLETTADLINPCVIEIHPCGTVAVGVARWLSTVPEIVGMRIFVSETL